MKNLLPLIALLTFSFCKKKAAEPTVSDEKMTAVLADCFAIEAAFQSADVIAKDSLSKKSQAQVFKLHGVDQNAFEKSLEAIASDPVRLDSILARAERKLKTENHAFAPKAEPPKPAPQNQN